MTATGVFQKDRLYRLKDPATYDDEYGQGYCLCRPVGGEYPITDCWIVNADGEVHPGLCNSPVPVRIEDVYPADLNIGAPSAA